MKMFWPTCLAALSGSMHSLRALCLCSILTLLLCQCRCLRACAGFFRSHASTGHNSRISGNLPAQAMTLEQFLATNARRGLSTDVLKTRFRVADADGDGWLTPGEIERHRVKAAQNKLREQDG